MEGAKIPITIIQEAECLLLKETLNRQSKRALNACKTSNPKIPKEIQSKKSSILRKDKFAFFGM